MKRPAAPDVSEKCYPGYQEADKCKETNQAMFNPFATKYAQLENTSDRQRASKLEVEIYYHYFVRIFIERPRAFPNSTSK